MSKLVSLSNEAYATLSRMKGKNMSFSDVIVMLVNKGKPKRNFLRFAGALKTQAKSLEELKKEIEADRKRNINEA